jgi:hypothetical protein
MRFLGRAGQKLGGAVEIVHYEQNAFMTGKGTNILSSNDQQVKIQTCISENSLPRPRLPVGSGFVEQYL